MAEALSPAGDRHPGEIVFENQIENTSDARAASEVPQGIAWVWHEAAWVPVVRVVFTGAGRTREITSFGPGGQFLSRTAGTVS